MSEKLLPDYEDDIVIDAPSQPSLAAEQPNQKPQPQAGISAGSSKKQGIFADKKNLPIYGAFLVILAVLLWYVFDEKPSVPQTSMGQFAASGQGRTIPPPPPDSSGISAGVVKQFSSVLLQQREQIDALVQQIAQLNGRSSRQQSQIHQLEQQVAALSVTGARTASTVSRRQVYLNSTLLTDMKINDIQPDLAWVRYKGQVYALQAGDFLGGTQVLQIDMNRRLVITTKGLIR